MTCHQNPGPGEAWEVSIDHRIEGNRWIDWLAGDQPHTVKMKLPLSAEKIRILGLVYREQGPIVLMCCCGSVVKNWNWGYWKNVGNVAFNWVIFFLSPLKNPSLTTKPVAKYASLTSTLNRSLALTPTYPTPSLSLLTADHPTWSINFIVQSVFTLQKRVNCSQNAWMGIH